MKKIAVFLLAAATLALGGCGYNDMQRSDEQVKAAWAEVSDDDCTAIGEVSAVSAGAFRPGEAIKKYVSPAMPNAATIAVPAIRFGRRVIASDRLLGSGGSKGSSPPTG